MAAKNRRRALRNLLIAALLLLFVWYTKGCPLPTLEMELHRAERQALAEKSTVIWSYRGTQYSDRDMLVGVTADAVHTYSERGALTIWPRAAAAPTLVALPEPARYFSRGSYLDPALLAVDPPPQAVSARLTIIIPRPEGGAGEVYRLEGTEERGCFFFQLASKHRHQDSAAARAEEEALWLLRYSVQPEDLDLCSYTLEFFGADGSPLQAVSN